jgi:hypothetical protein
MEILKEYDNVCEQLFESVSSFSEQDFNAVPFAKSWTPGQVCEHVFKSLTGTLKTLSGPSKVSARQPDEKVKAIKDLFLNFDIKMQSPQPILPGDALISQKKILSDLQNITTEIRKAASELDLSEVCTLFELPTFGEFTRYEWVYFAICHTMRHTHQLENISKAIKATV